MASLEVHGVIGPTTLRRLCAEQTMANHCKTQFTEQGSDQSYRSFYLHRHSCAGLGVQVWERRDMLAIPLKSGCSGATVDGKNPANPVIMHIRLIRVIYQSEMSKWWSFFPSRVCSDISHSCVSISCVFASLGSSKSMSKSLRVLCAMQETFWQQGVFFLHQVTTGVEMLKSVSPWQSWQYVYDYWEHLIFLRWGLKWRCFHNVGDQRRI